MDPYAIIGRQRPLFQGDLERHETDFQQALKGARILVYGGAGSIGREITAQIFKRGPKALHVVDISENNLVELVRDLRSSLGYIDGDTQFLPLDMGGVESRAFVESQAPYDYILNLAAMKHVRSEKDAFSLMRMIKTNVLDTLETLQAARRGGTNKYFAVSTDKAKNPANLMGATKRIMEDVLFGETGQTAVSTARFANVAFSDGSLLHGFRQRLQRRQPIAAPRDVRRYFVTGEESGLLCLFSLVLGSHREIFFPKLNPELELLTFSDIAVRFLESQGLQPHPVENEDEARGRVEELAATGRWPCYFFDSDTAGEKPFEEFYSDTDVVDWQRLEDFGVITAPALTGAETTRVEDFLSEVEALRRAGRWTKAELTTAISSACPELRHVAKEFFLDQKM